MSDHVYVEYLIKGSSDAKRVFSRRSLLTLADTEVLRAFLIEWIDNFFRLRFRLQRGSGDSLLAFLQSPTGRFPCRRCLLRRRRARRRLYGRRCLLGCTCCSRHRDD